MSSSMSAKTGRAPTRRIALAVETKVNEGQITSCAGPDAERQQRQLQRVRAGGGEQHARAVEPLGEPVLDAPA